MNPGGAFYLLPFSSHYFMLQLGMDLEGGNQGRIQELLTSFDLSPLPFIIAKTGAGEGVVYMFGYSIHGVGAYRLDCCSLSGAWSCKRLGILLIVVFF